MNLIEDAFDAAVGEIAEADDRLDLLPVGGEIIGHAGDDLALIERRLRHFPRDAERLEDARNALDLLHAISGAGHFDGRPDEIAGFHQALVDEILRPVPAERHIVAADIGVETRLRIGRVEIDDRDFGVIGLFGDLHEAAGIGAGGDDAVGLGGNRRTHRFLLRGDVAIVE
jgi:hypothetical protein